MNPGGQRATESSETGPKKSNPEIKMIKRFAYEASLFFYIKNIQEVIMVNVHLYNGWHEFGDNGIFADRKIGKALEVSLENLKSKVGCFESFHTYRRANDEYVSAYLREDLKPHLGIDDRGSLVLSTTVNYTFGRGKKNIGNNELEIYVHIYTLGGAHNSNVSTCPAYKYLKEKLGEHCDVLTKSFELTTDQILDTGFLLNKVTEAQEEGIEKLRQIWRDIQNSKTEREIDFAGFATHIRDIFMNNGASVGVETYSDESSYSITVSDVDESVTGSLRLTNKGDGWFVEYTNYAFDFVDEIFDLDSSTYHQAFINDDKLDEVIDMIAKEYRRERELAYNFKNVRAQFIRDVVREKPY